MATNRIPYRTSLRVLGRLLNGDKARMVTVCEIDAGFLLHYFVQGDPCRVNTRAIHGAEVLDLDDLLHGQRGKPELDSSLKGLQSVLGFRQSEALKFQKTHSLCPMGYENALRALGETLDGRHAQAVLIHELDDSLHVEYTIDKADFVLRDGVRMAMPGRREERYTASGVEGLVRKCREQTAERVRRNGQNLSYNPLDVASYLDIAQTLEDDGHDRDAEDLFRRAARLAPTHPEAHFGLARLARRRGDRKAALKSLQSATMLDPANGRYQHLLGRINMERDQYDDAVAALQQAVTLEPGNRMYLYDLSRAYERLGRHEEASAALARYGAGAGVRPVSGDRAIDRASDRPAVGLADGAAPVERRAAARARAARQAEPSGDTRDALAAPRPHQNEPGGRGAARQERQGARLPTGWTTPTQRMGEAEQPARARETSWSEPISAGDPPAPFPSPSHDAEPPTLPRVAADSAAFPETSMPARPDATPFAAEAPAWGTTASAWPGARGSTGDEDPSSGTATVAGDVFPDGQGLPMLGLALANDWSPSALPTIHVPADGAAAAALPLAVTHDVESRKSTVQSGLTLTDQGSSNDGASASRRVTRGPSDEDAVQLAAALMRAEESARAEPHRADLHRKLGFLLAKQGRSDEAAAEFRRAVECGRRRFAE